MNLAELPTPITDAANCGWWNHPTLQSFAAIDIAVARRLERERAVLLRAVEAVEQSFRFRDVVRADGCPVCFCVKSWGEDHKEDCLIGQALTLTAPTES
jgi:hypothetical protein